MPALKVAVDNVALVLEISQVCREVIDLLSGLAVLVGHGNLDDWEGVEHVELGQVQGGVVVDGRRVLQNDEIKVSASTLAAS